MIPDIIDNRPGGVPDPRNIGPSFIQIGTEGGLLPTPAVLQNTPVGYVQNKRDITVGSIGPNEHTLLLGCAERGDVIIDFSQFAGKTLILYSDAPAPVPAGDPRNDYYTGDSDLTSQGRCRFDAGGQRPQYPDAHADPREWHGQRDRPRSGRFDRRRDGTIYCRQRAAGAHRPARFHTRSQRVADLGHFPDGQRHHQANAARRRSRSCSILMAA